LFLGSRSRGNSGRIELQIENLLLDAENPRFVRGSGQRDILQKILEDQQEKLYALAESIVDDGMNPWTGYW